MLRMTIMRVKNSYFLFLGLIAISLKLGVFFILDLPAIYPDSGGYLNLARMISDFDISGYSGPRTPVYPLIIAICNMNLTLVVVLQLILGILITLLMFKLTFIFTSNQRVAFVAALTYLLFVPQFYAEISIMAETVTTFFTTISVYCSVLYIVCKKSFYNIIISVVLGCFAALTKPLLFLLPFFIVLLYGVYSILKRENLRLGILRLAFILLIPVTAVISWSYINYRTNQVFTLSTLSGLGMTNAVGGFMIQRNDQYKEIRDIYLKYRKNQIEETGSYTNTIFKALPEMQEKTGLSYAQLSMRLQEMSKLEMSEQPLPYLKHIIVSAYSFWNPTLREDKENILSLKRLPSTIGRLVILALNISFILALPAILILLIYKRELIQSFGVAEVLLFCFIYILVISSSCSQGMVENGTFRYSLPFQPVTSCFALIYFCSFISVLFSNSRRTLNPVN